MKKCNQPMKKTSDEDAQESAEESETKKGKEYEANPEKQVEKGEEEEEAMETKEILAGIHKMMKEIHALISSDKKVHKEVEKAPPDEDWKDKEEEGEREKMAHEEEGRARREERKDDASTPKKEYKEKVGAGSGVRKAAMEQDFQKALDAAVAPLQLQINALATQVQKLGDEPLYKAGIYLKELQVEKDGKPELGNAGMLAAQRKKAAGK